MRYAFHECQWCVFIQPAETLPGLHDAHRIHQCLIVVKNGFMMHPRKFAGAILEGLIDLNTLQVTAELRATVIHPGLDVRGPRDERLAIPESNGFTAPLRHRGP